MPFGDRHVVSMLLEHMDSPQPKAKFSPTMRQKGVQHLSGTEIVVMPTALFQAVRDEFRRVKSRFSLSTLVNLTSQAGGLMTLSVAQSSVFLRAVHASRCCCQGHLRDRGSRGQVGAAHSEQVVKRRRR